MKNYAREELEQLATEKPQELALLFARIVDGDKYAVISTWEDSRDIQILKSRSYQAAQKMLTDWTAVIYAGKKAEIKWDRNVIDESDDGIEECHYRAWKWKNNWLSNRRPVKCHQKPEWPDCAALMIVMIEVQQPLQGVFL